MNNNIFELNESFNFDSINLGNPTLINNNTHFSKISHGPLNKNVYMQFPKCLTKSGITKTSNKTICELNFNMADKNVIEFFENLERICVEQIFKNKELWLYDSQDFEKNDIEELMSSTMKPYKHGRNFLVKTYIKSDKFQIYDENENKLANNEYDLHHEIIPLVNINGIKFTSKNFTLELILSQIMVLYPSDEFEKQILIKTNKSNIKENIDINKTLELSNNIINDNVETENIETENIETENIETENVETENVETENVETENIETENIETENIETENIETKNDNKLICSLEKTNNNYPDLECIEIDSIKNKDDIVELKSHNEIYLEIYKNAKLKAKQIRKNAINAFLEAKNIKDKYNLHHVIDSDSSDEEESFAEV